MEAGALVSLIACAGSRFIPCCERKCLSPARARAEGEIGRECTRAPAHPALA